MRGVAEAVAAVGLPVCVASSSDPVRLRHSLTLTGLLPLFGDRVFSSAQVARGKPFPDLFLFAADRMGVEPSACLVIEDSVPGVTAARSAGMRVAGFTGGGHWGHDPAGADLVQAGADRIFSDFSRPRRSDRGGLNGPASPGSGHGAGSCQGWRPKFGIPFR